MTGQVQRWVTEFHRAFDIPVGIECPDLAMFANGRDVLRAELVSEEAREVIEALAKSGPAHIAKELADLVIVAYGTAVELGIDLDSVVHEVHKSNMTKLDENGQPVLREDGKVLKSRNYQEPKITHAVMKGEMERV